MTPTIKSQNFADTPRTSGPYFSLDAWRGVASLWVLGFHAASQFHPEHAVVPLNVLYTLMSFGDRGVQLFFVISGYCILSAAAANLNRDKNPIGYLKARIRRIYPPYWASLILTLLLALAIAFLAHHGYLSQSRLAERLPNSHQAPLFWLSNFTLTTILFHQISLIYPAWTLCYEVAFYVIVGLALWGVISRRQDEETLLLALHGLALLCLLALLLLPTPPPFPFDLWPQFGLGIVVYDAIKFPHRGRARLMLLLSGFAILALSSLTPYEVIGGHGPYSFPSFAICWIFAVLLIWLHRHDKRLVKSAPLRPLFAVGAFSYSLYITHILIVGTMHQLMTKLHLSSAGYPYLLFFLTVVSAIGFAWAFYLVFERPFISKRRQQIVQTIHHVPVEPLLPVKEIS